MFILCNGGELRVCLEYKNGATSIIYTSHRLKNDVEKWVDHGLHEWYRENEIDGAYPRSTESSSPDFLPRLKDYLDKQFGYHFQLKIGERFMIELEKRFGDRDWFHSVGKDQYGRVVVYIKYACQETLLDIPDRVDGKQVLVHLAGYLLASREVFVAGPNKPVKPEADVDILTRDVKTLVNDLGKGKVRDIFYEIHDGAGALTQLSDMHPYARECLEKLYDEYGFDVLFDLLEE